MDQKKWIGKVVKVILHDGKYFKGTIEDEDSNSFFLIDIESKAVYISKESINTMYEVKQ